MRNYNFSYKINILPLLRLVVEYGLEFEIKNARARYASAVLYLHNLEYTIYQLCNSAELGTPLWHSRALEGSIRRIMLNLYVAGCEPGSLPQNSCPTVCGWLDWYGSGTRLVADPGDPFWWGHRSMPRPLARPRMVMGGIFHYRDGCGDSDAGVHAKTA